MPIEAQRGPDLPGSRCRGRPSTPLARSPWPCKPPDDPSLRGVVLRVRETAGRTGPVRIEVPRWRRAVRLDLLERERGELPITDGTLHLDLPAHGLAAVRLE